MPRVLAARRRRPTGQGAATPTAAADAAAAPEWVEWVEWPDEPRHELLFDIPEPAGTTQESAQQQQQEEQGRPLAARSYAAVFPAGDEDRWTLFHRHREDTAYICASAAADDAADAEVWNEELRELEGGAAAAEAADGDSDGATSARPTHELLAPVRVHHSTGMCFCNPHRTRDRSAYIHRIRYVASNPRTLHFVGVEVRPRAGAGSAAAATTEELPQVPAPYLSLKLEYEQPGLFRAWRLTMGPRPLSGGGGNGAEEAAALGGGFARRGGAVVLIKAADWSKIAYECADSGGPFGDRARARARGAGGWSGAAAAAAAAAAATGDSSGGGVFPEGAAWPLFPEDGRAPFSLSPKDAGAVLEAMIVEFL